MAGYKAEVSEFWKPRISQLRRLGIMSTLSEEKVLRINCPGFGVSSTLPLGEAKPLAMYDVIIINPSSVLHLFDTKSDIIRQIETLQLDGMTSCRAEDDNLLESIAAELDLRTQEMSQFLKKGGLLIYFLTPPFVMQGPAQTMDNYSWLSEWAPDKPTGPNQRNMSATIRGKAVDTTADGNASVWQPYLKQANLEWSTIIRNENLSDGYKPLAVAGPNKCIAAFRESGPRGGQIVFLPAPFEENLDAKLKECLMRWYQNHSAEGGEPAATLSGLLSEDAPALNPEPAVASPEPAFKEPEAPPTPAPRPEFFDFDKTRAESQEPTMALETRAAVGPSTAESAPEVVGQPEAKDLMRKMEQEISKPVVPEWCAKYSFTELDGLRTQLSDLNEEIRLAQIKAGDLGTRIEIMEDLKNALLSSQGDHLINACTRVFEVLGWRVKPAAGNPDELWLMEDDKTQAIVRLIYTSAQPNRSELAALAESVITYWGAHEVEPKGILVASTWADRPPAERTDEDYPEAMNEFAKRKNLCLSTTAQLLSIYRDLVVAGADPREIRDNILTTSGQVAGYRFEQKGKVAPAVK